tara:strand:+ start:16426 stop:16956 length:531 start_codon:yes stop_codon:yes gene_type:complete
METHLTNLITANIWKCNQWKYRNKFHGGTQIYQADCGERLPHWVVITKGFKGLEIGWNHRNQFFAEDRPAASTHSIGRQTQADLESGFSGGLCSAWAKEAWSRHERGAPCEHKDNHHRFGIEKLYIRLAFKRQWHERKVGGWSGRAFMLLDDPNRERQDYRGWSMGCPEWYASHQP